jgi:hypothetical protein
MEEKQIKLTAKERAELERFCSTGAHNVRLVDRAKTVLALDTSGGRTPERHEAMARRLGISRQTVSNARGDFLAAESIAAFLRRKKRSAPPKVTGELEARIIALACGKVPKGRSRWTLRLRAEKCVEPRYCGSLSHMTISRLLKKHSLSPT